MTKHLTRKVNGKPQGVVVSDAKAKKLIEKGWQIVKPNPVAVPDKIKIDAEPVPYFGKKRGRKPKAIEE